MNNSPSSVIPTSQADTGRRLNWARALEILAVVVVVLSAVVFARRGIEAWDAGHHAPGVATTSGCEEESFYALWRVIHGQPAFVDTLRPPFASSYFNWLFYHGYGAVMSPVVLERGDAAIPWIGRIVTACGACVGVAMLWWLFRRILAGQTLFAGAIATFIYFGPLVGWWAHTLRPDVWALTFEAAAITLVLVAYRQQPLFAAASGLLLFNAAWACKQTAVIALGTTFVFFIIRRRFRLAIVLAIGMVLLVAISAFVLGPPYLESQRATASQNAFSVAIGLTNLASTLQKSAPLLLLVLAVPAARLSRNPSAPPLAADALVFGSIGLAIGVLFAFVTSCKVGASSNYYFTVVLMAAVAGIGAVARRPQLAVPFLFCTTAIAVQVLVFFGVFGRISLASQVQSLNGEWQVYGALPEPRFASDLRLNQPWLNPHSPPLVLAYNYALLYRAGAKFEGGGIGGVIERGELASLLLATDADEFYGGRLDRYVRTKAIDGFAVYQRK